MVRVTEDEHAAIVKAADGAKLSAYVRECALTGIAARAPVEPPFMDETRVVQSLDINPVALWQSNLNHWYRDGEGRKEMIDELGKGLVFRMEALPMEQRAAFLAQELG